MDEQTETNFHVKCGEKKKLLGLKGETSLIRLQGTDERDKQKFSIFALGYNKTLVPSQGTHYNNSVSVSGQKVSQPVLRPPGCLSPNTKHRRWSCFWWAHLTMTGYKNHHLFHIYSLVLTHILAPSKENKTYSRNINFQAALFKYLGPLFQSKHFPLDKDHTWWAPSLRGHLLMPHCWLFSWHKSPFTPMTDSANSFGYERRATQRGGEKVSSILPRSGWCDEKRHETNTALTVRWPPSRGSLRLPNVFDKWLSCLSPTPRHQL